MLTNDKKIFEKGLIYHDSCAVAYFGDQMQDFSTDVFCGAEYRTNEITSAILRIQLTRLDGILADLRKNKKLLKEALAGQFNFAPVNDPEGDCAATITFQFDTPEEAKALCDKVKGLSIPAYVDKHVYCYWDAIFEKRGAAHPLMNPFNMEANKNAPEYTKDMCQKSFDILARSVQMNVSPDWSKEKIEEIAKELIAAK